MQEQTLEQRKNTFDAAGISANDLTETGELKVPKPTVVTSSPATRILDSTAAIQSELEAALAQDTKRLAEIDTELKTKRESSDSVLTSLKDLFSERSSKEELLTKERERLGIENDLNLSRGLITEIGGLREQIAKLDEQEATFINNLYGQGRGIPQGILEGQAAKAQRDFAIRKSGVAAVLSAKASTLEALRGNITLANTYASQTVDALLYDENQKVKDFQDLFDFNKDIIDSLTSEQKTLLNERKSFLEKSYEEKKKEREDVLRLMVDNPRAGITPTDTPEEAARKVVAAGGSIAARKEDRIANDSDSSDSDGSDRFTQTQLNKGAKLAGLDLGTFKGLDAEVQNFYINSNATALEKFEEIFADVASGDEDPESVKAEIDASNRPQSVKDHLKARVDASVPAGGAAKKKAGSFFARTWDSIWGAIKTRGATRMPSQTPKQ